MKNSLAKLVGWLLAPFYLATFALILLVFHPIQILTLRLCGYTCHKLTIDLIDWLLLANLRICGTSIQITYERPLPEGVPLIVVSNHQSLYDIPLLGWVFRHHHLKYVSKKELGKGIPSVSYNLRHGGSVLIDRDNPRQSVSAVGQFGKYIEEHRYAACLFPEGTRGRDGVMKPFKSAGFSTLVQHTPSALIVPTVIKGSWELARYGLAPIPFGVQLSCTVLAPISQDGRKPKELLELAESRIRAEL
ncbi:MAG: 1-acyl-sn-glycerol-3-phosphate acyltransferase [Deltaproteobacteria bacterium]|nr:1-acyl-sn-glycerol-3-phosphate acyltransferase [Deltaproteobacteria bacterium]